MTHSAFDGFVRLASGPLPEVAVTARRAIENGAAGPVLIYDDSNGHVVDLDMGVGEAEMVARLARTEPARERGRPRLGVMAREVTLLPRHWDWLRAQPGGASVALRKLVEQARRANGDQDRWRERRDGAYRFLSAMGGDLPGFEEASRALFAGDRVRFEEMVAGWPADVREHAIAMAFGADHP